MKKTYIAPKSNVIELETEALMIDTSFGISSVAVEDPEDILEGGSRSTLWGED